MTHTNRLRATGVAAAVVLAATALVAAWPQQVRDQTGPGVQPAATGTALVSGVVMSDEPASVPVRRAIVSARSGEGARARGAVTDDEGRFSIAGLPAGRFTLSVSKAGWVTTLVGAKRPWRPPGVAIALTDGQQVTGLAIKMMRGAVITGRITDDNGRPLAATLPSLLESRTTGGQRQWIPVSISPGLDATDDRGEYRFYGLPPGTYLIAVPISQTGGPTGLSGFRVTTAVEVAAAERTTSANSSPASLPQPQKYATAYYPDVTDPSDARTITVAAGEERRGVDVTVHGVPTSKVAGTITRADGRPETPGRVTIFPLSEGALTATAGQNVGGTVQTDANGQFVFGSVRPGRYAIRARGTGEPSGAPLPIAPGRAGLQTGPRFDQWASTEVVVAGSDVTGIALSLQPGATLSGRVAIDSASAQPSINLQTVSIRLTDRIATGSAGAIDPSALVVPRVSPDGTFTLVGIPASRYSVTVQLSTPALAERWITRSIAVDGRDVLASGLDIANGQPTVTLSVTLTDRVGELSGALRDTAGRPVPEYFVFAFPADRSAWTAGAARIRPPVRPSSDGRYRLAPLLPGDYFVVALTDFEELDYLDSTFLTDLIPSAVRVTIAAGQQQTQDLRLTGF